jgi:hypothetical protein
MAMLDPFKTSLPASWSIPFVVTLRSSNVTGAAIGAALREVESHCAESGQAPIDAFGDPEAYADSLQLPLARGSDGMVSTLAPSVVGLVGLLLTTPTVAAWRLGTAVEVSTGLAVSAVIAVTVVALVARPQVFRKRALFGGLAIGGFLAVFLAPMLWTGTAFRAPVLLCGAVAVAAVLVSALWQRHTLDPDVITDPLAPRSPAPGRWFTILTTWLFPLLALASAILTWVLPTPA